LAADSVADNVEEPAGFIGKYSKKLEEKKKAEEEARKQQEEIAAMSAPGQIRVQIPLSENAPKHKGMLARAMERDLKEAKEREAREKEEIMNAALNDPLF
jgi:hypothetical protein